MDAGARHPRRGPAAGAATDPARPRRRRWAGALAALVLAALLAGGCGFVTGLVHTQSQLEQAGYDDATVSFQTTGARTTVLVTADRSATASPDLAAQARGAAGVVWRTLPGSFQRLRVTIRGVGTASYGSGQLAAVFGTRPGSLDQQSLSAEAATSGAVVVAVAIALLLVVTVVVVVLVAVVRRRRRRARAARTSLLMATIPEHLWGAADPSLGPVGPPVAQAPAPPIPPPPQKMAPPVPGYPPVPPAPHATPGQAPAAPPPAAGSTAPQAPPPGQGHRAP